MATSSTPKKTQTTGPTTAPASAPRLADLIADAAELQSRAAKLLADLLACKAAGGDNAYGGDLVINRGVK